MSRARRCLGRPAIEADFVPGAPGSDLPDGDRRELARFRAFLQTPDELKPLAWGVLYPEEPALEGGDA